MWRLILVCELISTKSSSFETMRAKRLRGDGASAGPLSLIKEAPSGAARRGGAVFNAEAAAEGRGRTQNSSESSSRLCEPPLASFAWEEPTMAVEMMLFICFICDDNGFHNVCLCV